MKPDEHQEKTIKAKAAFLADLRACFDSPAGKSVLAWLHATAATRKPCFVPGDRDPYAAASRDGRKSIVWEIEANLEQARADYGKTPGTDKPPATGGTRARKQRG
jgi:hypothetical protein